MELVELIAEFDPLYTSVWKNTRMNKNDLFIQNSLLRINLKNGKTSTKTKRQIK